MATGWYPAAIVDRGNDSGAYTDLGEPKGLLHTTEGKSYAGARGAYVQNNSWPHFTATYENGRFVIYQHNSVLVASRSLRNESGGVQTNRDNVVQIELVGTADRNKASSWGAQYSGNFPKGYLDGIAAWMRWVEAVRGVPRRSTVTWKAYPESYGANGVRLSGAQWDAYSGWLGHQHAPENSHGDPGLIDIKYLLSGEDDMTPEDHAKIAATVRAESQRLGQYLALGQRNLSFSDDVWLSGTTNPKLLAAVNGVVVDVDEAAIAAAVVAAIAGTVHVEVDPALVTEAVKTALRQGTAA